MLLSDESVASRLLKKGDWLRANYVFTCENSYREAPVPLFQQSASRTDFLSRKHERVKARKKYYAAGDRAGRQFRAFQLSCFRDENGMRVVPALGCKSKNGFSIVAA